MILTPHDLFDKKRTILTSIQGDCRHLCNPECSCSINLWFKNLKSDKSNFEDAIIDNSDLVGHLRRNEAIHVRGAIMNTGNLRDPL